MSRALRHQRHNDKRGVGWFAIQWRAGVQNLPTWCLFDAWARCSSSLAKDFLKSAGDESRSSWRSTPRHGDALSRQHSDGDGCQPWIRRQRQSAVKSRLLSVKSSVSVNSSLTAGKKQSHAPTSQNFVAFAAIVLASPRAGLGQNKADSS